MTRVELAALSREDLIAIGASPSRRWRLCQATMSQLQADYAALRLKLRRVSRPRRLRATRRNPH